MQIRFHGSHFKKHTCGSGSETLKTTCVILTMCCKKDEINTIELVCICTKIRDTNLEFSELPVLVVEPLLQLLLPLINDCIGDVQLLNMLLVIRDAILDLKCTH